MEGERGSMSDVDLEKVRTVISDLLKKGDEESAQAIWNLKDEYIKLQAVFLSCPQGSGNLHNDSRFNFLSIPAGEEDRQIFNRWDFNLREDKAYACERGSAVEWHWAQFLVNHGPVTRAMVEHAIKADPEGWKKAAYELEEEGE